MKNETITITTEFEFNKNDTIKRFKADVNNGTGSVNNILVMISAMNTLETSVKLFLEDDELPDRDRVDFEYLLNNLERIKQNINDVGENELPNLDFNLN